MGEAKKDEDESQQEKEEEKLAEEKMKQDEAAPRPMPLPPPPPVVVLNVDLHCDGCIRKIRACILKCKGVERVEVDKEQNLVMVTGALDPEVLCTRVSKKTMRKVQVISPVLAPPEVEAEAAAPAGEVQPEEQKVDEILKTELHVNMHCEGCAQQLQRKLLKLKGVELVEPDLSANRLTVTGTVSGEELSDYIYRRTNKVATVISSAPLPPMPPPDDDQKAEEKPSEEAKDASAEAQVVSVEEKKDRDEAPGDQELDKKVDDGKEVVEGDAGDEEEVAKSKELTEAAGDTVAFEDDLKKMVQWNYNSGWYDGGYYNGEEPARGVAITPWMPLQLQPYPAYYVMDHQHPNLPPFPPSQYPLFLSDENPNACCIS